METQVSSLYGPGAIICWLCTSAAVILSWSFNRSSRRYDTITGDFLACLLLPVIALSHLLYEISHATRSDNWTATPTMDATFAICMDFVPFSFVLCCLAYHNGHVRRFLLTIMATLASSIMVLVGYNANGHNVPHFDHENAAFPMILSIFVMVGSCLMTLVCVLIYHDSPPQRSRARLGIVVVLAACSLSNVVGFFRFSPKRPEGSESEFQWVPHTGYSIREIDQAVALGIGIATLLLSIYDILRDIRFSPDDEFEFWRSRCIKNIEAGYTEIEITRWRNELDRIDTQAKCQRTRARHRERELKTWKELPKNVMREIENYEVAKRMAAIFVS